ncbi:BREX-2 system adenine-specific DNA-methyltransferase PglX [Nocardiopsis nanhaiensis]
MAYASLLRELRSLTLHVLDDFRGTVSASSTAWRDIECAAAMWALAPTFVTFCEQEGLVDTTVLGLGEPSDPGPTHGSGPTEEAGVSDNRRPHEDPVHTLEQAMDSMVREHPVLGPAFSPDTGSWRTYRPSAAVAHRLLTYLRGDGRAAMKEATKAHASGSSEESNTELFGGLYQELSETARKMDALLTTPGFVIDEILRQTLDPALEEAAPVTEHGIRFIDPACGSGGFLLKALHRVFDQVRAEDPGLSPDRAVEIALSCVHGADRNPIAVMVSRFRLAVEALRLSGGVGRAEEANWRVIVVEADSLLAGERAPSSADLFAPTPTRPPSPWPASAKESHVLARSSYDVVAANPPYNVPRDKEQALAYRDAYPSARSGLFAMTVPFTECAFSLTCWDGRVGLLLSSSFARREFGKRLIEDFLPTVRLDRIIDTSGAYIPGHGTPTLILTGRNRRPTPESTVTVVAGLRGEPTLPAEPEHGKVWTSIRGRLARVPSEDPWTVSQERPLADYRSHPWQLTSPSTETLFRSLRSPRTLGDQVQRIGYVASTGADDLFTASPASMHRWGGEDSATIDIITGSEVRDWQARSEQVAFFPRDRTDRSRLVDIDDLPGHRRRLWPYRTPLEDRLRTTGKAWYDWHQLTANQDASPWSIIFPWVASHPHFALRKADNAPLNSAPVIELPLSVSEEDVLGLLGALNSSVACFWLKQVSNAKGNPREGQLRSGDTWDTIYEFTATRMRDLPLPSQTDTELPRRLDALACQLQEISAQVADSASVPAGDRIAQLGREWNDTLRRMVLLQEELDWRLYEAYGLVSAESPTHVSPGALPDGIDLGHRAFEIALAHRIADGEEENDWFARHAATPVTEPPAHWSAEYRHAVTERVAALESTPALKILERPDFKHRWTTPSWERVWRPVVTSWLLDRCERRELWYTQEADGTERPTSRTLAELIALLEDDPGVTAAAEVLNPESSLRELVPELLAPEHVPFLPALRFRPKGLEKHAKWKQHWAERWRAEHPAVSGDTTEGTSESQVTPTPRKFTSADFLRSSYWANRGKFDMPNERFISYPSGTSSRLSPTSVVGWAGWDATERAEVLVDIIDRHLAPPAAPTEAVIPLLAGLAEVLPWTDRVAAGIGPVSARGGSAKLRSRFEEFLAGLDLTEEELASWAPPAPRRGRPPKRATG